MAHLDSYVEFRRDSLNVQLVSSRATRPSVRPNIDLQIMGFSTQKCKPCFYECLAGYVNLRRALAVCSFRTTPDSGSISFISTS
jgi:hypothetical protein